MAERAAAARQAHTLKDAGSSPASATTRIAGRIHIFIPHMTAGKDRQHASVAQLVEQLLCKRQVAGSRPAGSSNCFIGSPFLFLRQAAPIGAALSCPDFYRR